MFRYYSLSDKRLSCVLSYYGRKRQRISKDTGPGTKMAALLQQKRKRKKKEGRRETERGDMHVPVRTHKRESVGAGAQGEFFLFFSLIIQKKNPEAVAVAVLQD